MNSPINLVDSSDIEEVAKDVKKKAAKGEEKSSSLDSPGSSDESEAESWEVDKILAHRVRGRRLEYRVHWKSWDDSWNTWLTVDNLHCPNVIADYHLKSPLTEEQRRSMNKVHSKKYLKLSKEADPIETRKVIMEAEQKKQDEAEEKARERKRVQAGRRAKKREEKEKEKAKERRAKEAETAKERKKTQKPKEKPANNKGKKRKRDAAEGDEGVEKKKRKRTKKPKEEESENQTHPDLAYNYLYPKDEPEPAEPDDPLLIMTEEQKVALAGIHGYAAAKKRMLMRKDDEDELTPPKIKNASTEPRDQSRGYEIDRIFTELDRDDKDKLFHILSKRRMDIVKPIYDALMREFMLSEEDAYEEALKFFHKKRFGF